MNIQNFIVWELTSRDTIDFKKIYVDISNGDLISGLLLSQIVYWHLPSKETGRTKLKVIKENNYWLVKERTDWYEEIRITDRQYDRAIKILEKLEIVILKKFKFDGLPKVHIRINWDTFLYRINLKLNEKKNKLEQKNDFDTYSPMGMTESVIPESHKMSFGNDGKCNSGMTESVIPLTKNTNIDYLTKNTNIDLKNNPIPLSLSEQIFELEIPMILKKKLEGNREKVNSLHFDIFELERFWKRYDWIKENCNQHDIEYLSQWDVVEILEKIFAENIKVESTTYGLLKNYAEWRLHFKKDNYIDL